MADEAKITTFRKYAASVLGPALGVEFKHEKVDGPVERTTLACIYSEGTQTDQEQVDDQLLVLTIRVFNPHRRRRSSRRGAGPTSIDNLEWAGQQIQATWREHVQRGGVWFSWVTTVEFDHDLQMVEAQIVARSSNPSILPG